MGIAEVYNFTLQGDRGTSGSTTHALASQARVNCAKHSSLPPSLKLNFSIDTAVDGAVGVGAGNPNINERVREYYTNGSLGIIHAYENSSTYQKQPQNQQH